jgi:hypothetical protein
MPVYTLKYIFYFILILYFNTMGCPLLKKTPSTLTRAINTLLYVPGWLIVHSCRSKSFKDTDAHDNDNPTLPHQKTVRKGLVKIWNVLQWAYRSLCSCSYTRLVSSEYEYKTFGLTIIHDTFL